MLSNLRFYLYVIFSGFFVGIIGVFVKLIGDNVHFTTLVFYRMLIALVFVLIFVPFMDKSFTKVKKRDLFHYFIVGVLLTVTLTLFTVANLFAPVQNVVLITNFAPFLVLILGAFFLREGITKEKVITLIIAFAGIVIINPLQFGENTFGNFLALLQAFFFAILIVVMRKENRVHSISSIIWIFFFATLVLLPFPFIYGFGEFQGNVLWYVIALGVLSTGIAYLLQSLALEKLRADVSSIIIMITMPLSGIIFAFLVLSESLNLRVIAGGVILIVAGIYFQFSNKGFKRAVKTAFELHAS
jgi:drug/metabolite transporter (DMT)-like permease